MIMQNIMVDMMRQTAATAAQAAASATAEMSKEAYQTNAFPQPIPEA
jgi:hypothetical protein